MYTIEDFNNEKNRLMIQALISPSTPDLTLLRQIYQDLCVVDEELRYDPSDSDSVFWKKTKKFEKRLLERK